MAFFPTFFFRRYRPRKGLLRYSRRKKAPFYAIKATSSNSRKIDIVPNGLTHGFGPKMAIFSTSFVLSNIGQKNVFYDILERKNAFLSYKKEKVQKVKKLTFFRGV